MVTTTRQPVSPDLAHTRDMLWRAFYMRLPVHRVPVPAQYLTTTDGEVWVASTDGITPTSYLMQDRDVACLVDAYNLLTYGVRLTLDEDAGIEAAS